MGCDIHTAVEVRRGGTWELVSNVDLFNGRNYGTFGFLADVRNYSHSPVIAEPRDIPADATAQVREAAEWQDAHSRSWLTAAELQSYDYDVVFWDRRITRGNDGAALAEEGEGRHLTLREFLGPWFFTQVDELAKLGNPEDVRLIFWFDN